MRLIEWSLATFHTCFFVAMLALLVYQGGGLGSLLASLNTIVGITIFIYLWLTTWYCTRRVTRRAIATEQLMMIGRKERTKIYLIGPLWGGANGLFFFLPLAVIFLVFSLSVPTFDQFIIDSILILAISAPIAFIIGAIIGLIFTIVDIVIIDLSQVLAKSFIPNSSPLKPG